MAKQPHLNNVINQICLNIKDKYISNQTNACRVFRESVVVEDEGAGRLGCMLMGGCKKTRREPAPPRLFCRGILKDGILPCRDVSIGEFPKVIVFPASHPPFPHDLSWERGSLG